MEALGHLYDGLAVALTPKNLLVCFVGCFWGTVVGVLPGLGPLAGWPCSCRSPSSSIRPAP